MLLWIISPTRLPQYPWGMVCVLHILYSISRPPTGRLYNWRCCQPRWEQHTIYSWVSWPRGQWQTGEGFERLAFQSLDNLFPCVCTHTYMHTQTGRQTFTFLNTHFADLADDLKAALLMRLWLKRVPRKQGAPLQYLFSWNIKFKQRSVAIRWHQSTWILSRTGLCIFSKSLNN